MVNPFPYTDSTETLTSYIQGKLDANKASFIGPDGSQVQDVWYADQTDLSPRTPCVVVIPGPERSAYHGVGGRPVLITFQTFVMVYYQQVVDLQQNVHGSLTIANQIKRFVHSDVTLGNNVIDCLCVALEPGVMARRNTLFDATRITFQSRAKTALNP